MGIGVGIVVLFVARMGIYFYYCRRKMLAMQSAPTFPNLAKIQRLSYLQIIIQATGRLNQMECRMPIISEVYIINKINMFSK
jgi:DNA-directed RNA polymerase subunit N (RpoN/RPB10)